MSDRTSPREHLEKAQGLFKGGEGQRRQPSDYEIELATAHAQLAIAGSLIAATEARAQEEMRSGPRYYTPEQADFIERTAQERQPLDEPPLPVDEGRIRGRGGRMTAHAKELIGGVCCQQPIDVSWSKTRPYHVRIDLGESGTLELDHEIAQDLTEKVLDLLAEAEQG